MKFWRWDPGSLPLTSNLFTNGPVVSNTYSMAILNVGLDRDTNRDGCIDHNDEKGEDASMREGGILEGWYWAQAGDATGAWTAE